MPSLKAGKRHLQVSETKRKFKTLVVKGNLRQVSHRNMGQIYPRG